eukprot:TRINITY_DN43542_c0_g1_i1.p1 TRINITY_DN43542_c0_g1~~TRINITY_DN43542_c0_g1_i1.p1  ORF type:complete len:782 (+),score=64.69 TRINITY_DN43542_c0_g1_i1:415-2760(+)
MLWDTLGDRPLAPGGGTPQERVLKAHGETVNHWAEWAGLAAATPRYPSSVGADDTAEEWVWLCSEAAASLPPSEEQRQHALAAELVACLLPTGWTAKVSGEATAGLAPDNPLAIAVLPPAESAAGRAAPNSEARRMHAIAIRTALKSVLPLTESEVSYKCSDGEPVVEITAAASHRDCDPRLASCLVIPPKVSEAQVAGVINQLVQSGTEAYRVDSGAARLVAFESPIAAAHARRSELFKGMSGEFRLAGVPYAFTVQPLSLSFADSVSCVSVPLRSALLCRAYLHQGGPSLRVALCLLMRWARRHGVVSAGDGNGFLSPHGMLLLVVHYFAQEGGMQFVTPDLVDTDLLLRDLPSPTPQDTFSAVAVVRGFFRYYSSFPWSREAAAVHLPGPVPLADTGWSEEQCLTSLRSEDTKTHQHMQLCVVCPITRWNVTRRVSSCRGDFIKGMFVLTHALLSHPRPGSPLGARLVSLFGNGACPTLPPSRTVFGASALEFLQLVDPHALPAPISSLPLVKEVGDGPGQWRGSGLEGWNRDGGYQVRKPTTKLNRNSAPFVPKQRDTRLTADAIPFFPASQLRVEPVIPNDRCSSPTYSCSAVTANAEAIQSRVHEVFKHHSMWDDSSQSPSPPPPPQATGLIAPPTPPAFVSAPPEPPVSPPSAPHPDKANLARSPGSAGSCYLPQLLDEDGEEFDFQLEAFCRSMPDDRMADARESSSYQTAQFPLTDSGACEDSPPDFVSPPSGPAETPSSPEHICSLLSEYLKDDSLGAYSKQMGLLSGGVV